MPTNFINLADGYFSKSIREQISDFLEVKPSLVSKALSGSLPTILGGIMNQGSTQSGLNTLMVFLIEDQYIGILDNLGTVLSNPAKSADLISGGSGILNTLFGKNKEKVTDAIGSFSGLDSSSASSLLSIITPVLVRIIGKEVKSNGLGMAGLASLLMSQKDSVKAAMPTELSRLSAMLNFDKLGDFKGGEIKSSLDEVQKAGMMAKWMKWGLPILAVFVIFLVFKNCK